MTSTPERLSPSTAPASQPEPADASQKAAAIPVWTVIAFILGCAGMIWVAANITNLSRWADEHGQILVYCVFFIAIGILGRWFWTGIDAILAAVRSRKQG